MSALDKKVQRFVRSKLGPLTVAMICALPAVANSAGLVMKNGTVYNTNGVPVVDINTPNSSGLSHNFWDDLNVDKNGLIFNNGTSASDTVLAGQIAGNSNLVGGPAKVILNEVVSRNASVINGMMEVAGNKADLIVANPNGITMNGGGSINTGKLTLTTGKAQLTDGELAGYNVNGGTITVGKLSSASPTEILSRNVVINGKVTADELNIVAGNNYVNARGEVAGTVAASGLRNYYSVDVSALGGMYANKINLVSTEAGVGVRNQGTIAGGVNGIKIDTKGILLNSNAKIQSAGLIDIKTNGRIDNTTGEISSIDTISINTNKGEIVNSRAGRIATNGNININSGALTNSNGKIAAAGMLAVDTNKATLTNTGKGKTVGIEAGIVALKTGNLNSRNGQISGGYVGIDAASIDNSGGNLQSAGDIDILSAGNINNNKGLIRAANGHLTLGSGGTISNETTKTADTNSSDSLGIISQKELYIGAKRIVNRGGQIASNDVVTVKSTGDIDNYTGKIVSSVKVLARGTSLNNDRGGLSADRGVDIAVSGTVSNNIGVISSNKSDVELNAGDIDNVGGLMLGENITLNAKNNVNNDTALIVARKLLNVNVLGTISNNNGNDFGARYGEYFGIPQQIGGMIGKEGVSFSARNINSTNSRIISDFGNMKLEAASTLNNTRGLLYSAGDMAIDVGYMFYNNYATTASAGNMNISTVSLQNYSNGSIIDNNATGIISSDKNLNLNVNNSFTNYGFINAEGDLKFNVSKGILYNSNTIAAGKDLTIDALNGIDNNGDIAGGEILTLKTKGSVTNRTNRNIVGKQVIISAGQNITNHGNIVSDNYMDVTANGTVYNYLNMLSYGSAKITANTVTNSGRDALLGAYEDFSQDVKKLNNTGTVLGM